MTRPHRRQRAFSLVEMLVVVSIIGLLMAILMPSLSAVKNRGRKSRELSHIRQVGYAWSLYAGGNNDAAAPGYLDPTSQGAQGNVIDRWDVVYKYPTNDPDDLMPDDIAAPWTWRLMPYFDYNWEIVRGHLEEDYYGIEMLVAEAADVATEPAFGYNGYYTGGWWEVVTINGVEVTMPRFWDARDADEGGPGGELKPINVVVRSLGQIRRGSEYIVFCSSSHREGGQYKKPLDNEAGSFMVVPSYLAEDEQWGLYSPDVGALEAFTETDMPIGRYTGAAALLYADAHTDNQMPGSLIDPRTWINPADQPRFGTGADRFLHTVN